MSLLLPRVRSAALITDAASSAGTEPVEFNDVTFIGVVDFSHREVRKPICIRNCRFTGEFLAENATFLQSVVLTGCRFDETVSFGRKGESSTELRKRLDLSDSTFAKNARFYGVRVRGSALFHRCRFTSRSHTCGFDSATVGGTLSCRNCVFTGDATFNAIRCEVMASFLGARFSNPDAVIDFVGSWFGQTLDCTSAVFAGSVILNGATCGLGLRLKGARFENPEGSLEMAHGRFRVMDCAGSIFHGAVGAGVHARIIDFAGARFLSRTYAVRFAHATVEQLLHLADAWCFGPVLFSGLNCKGDVVLYRAKLLGSSPALMRYVRVGGNLDFGNARVLSGIDLHGGRITGALDLCGAQVGAALSLNHTVMETLALSADGRALELLPDAKLDLQGISFTAFKSSFDEVKAFCARQTPESLSRDPYLNFERAWAAGGNEEKAAEIYFAGRRALTSAAWRRGNPVNWPLGTRMWDVVVWQLTGYGAKTRRLILIILCFLVAGVLVFWSPGSLRVEAPGSSKPPLKELRKELATRPLPQRLLDRVSYSIDLFVPVVDLGVAGKRAPVGFWREGYRLLHVVSGWFLLPLLIASFSGLTRGKRLEPGAG